MPRAKIGYPSYLRKTPHPPIIVAVTTPPTLDRVLDAVIRIDTGFGITFISESGLTWLSAPSSPASLLDIIAEEDASVFHTAIAHQPDTFACDLRLLKGGHPFWTCVRGYRLPDGKQYVLCVIDISPWKIDDAALRHAADHDELTGLPNRAFWKRTVEQAVREQRSPFSIALLDLDGFKKVNDTFGHAMGDAVLVETTRRLNKILGPDDFLARLGGDEFVIMLGGSNAANASTRLSAVLLAIARPYDTAPHNAYLGVSIGVAEFPVHGEDYSTILKNADTAMYHAKNGGKNRISVFTDTSENVDFSIKAAIHNGIQDGEFYLEYQPQYDTARRVIGAEALMRWNSGHFGRVPPDKFIPIAEESGLMPFLGRWALRCACHQLRQFQRQMPGFVMSVNVSPVQFGSDDFDQQVIDAVGEAGIDPTTLILEITESTLMHSQERTERALGRLREHGIRFSIDDFGTGFSSLAYLTRLPVSSIKIDKAFVRAIEENNGKTASDRRLVIAMINLAHSIDLKVVAEGVETEGQYGFLVDAGCNLYQGYLLSRPISSQTVAALMKQAA
jgi:diguanylate cyclase